MFLAGVPVPDRLVLEIARLVEDENLEMRLRGALARDVRVLALEIDERETIVRALEDAAPGLEELRAVLLQEHVQRACATGSSVSAKPANIADRTAPASTPATE